jgi:hypothetical protein
MRVKISLLRAMERGDSYHNGDLIFMSLPNDTRPMFFIFC